MPAFADIAHQLEHQGIEVPSWAYGNSGTRFKVFGSPGTPRTVEEKISDAATVHRFTGLAPKVALHIPWDRVDDYAKLADFAEGQGVRIGTINTNTFQDEDFKFGGLTHHDEAVRRKAIDHHLECIDVMHATGSTDLKIWLADGSNYPGQADIRGRQDRLADSLQSIYAQLADDQRLVLEYKIFEPAFYHTDVPDWGTALVQVQALGDQALVCLDTGGQCITVHQQRPCSHLLHIEDTANLARDLLLDVMTLIQHEHHPGIRLIPAAPDHLIEDAEQLERISRTHNEIVIGVVPGIEIERTELTHPQQLGDDELHIRRRCMMTAQEKGDVLGAHEVFMDAFYTDVRSDLEDWRESRGLPRSPMRAYTESGYQEKIEADRVGGTQMSW